MQQRSKIMRPNMGFAWKDVDPAFCLCCHARRIIPRIMDLEGKQKQGAKTIASG